MNRESITLIGMPGAGKSTIGVLLAKTMGYDFVDTDLLMQRQYGDVLHVLLRQNGLDRFKEMEERTLLGFSARHAVVATGGSAVYSDAGMRHLREISSVFYIDVPFPELEKRLKNISTRGVVQAKNETLYDLYLHRQPLYLKYADRTVSAAGLSPELIIERILALLEE